MSSPLLLPARGGMSSSPSDDDGSSATALGRSLRGKQRSEARRGGGRGDAGGRLAEGG
jgi:hypothetical protein